MKKLRLNLDELTLETFVTYRAETRVGTVAGHATRFCTDGGSCSGTCYMTCGDIACNTYYNQCGTYDEASCAGSNCFDTDDENTCVHTCLQSCPC